MNVKISKNLLKEVNKKYISVEYIVGETLPMINNLSARKIPPFYVLDEKEIIDIADDMIQDVRAFFSDQWEIDDCIQFLLTWGLLMEV